MQLKTIIVFILTLLFSLFIGSCVHLIEYEHDALITDSSGKATYITVMHFPFWQDVIIRSLLIGESFIDIDTLNSIHEWEFESHGLKWYIDTTPDLEDFILESGVVLQQYVSRSSDLLANRNFHGSLNLTIRLGLVPEWADVDYTARSRFVASPTLHFILPVNAESGDTLARSVIQAIGTIHHEMVHFGASLGKLAVPGSTDRERLINEETFAHVIAICDRFHLMDGVRRGEFRLTFPRPEIGGEASTLEEMFEILQDYGPSVLAQNVAYFVVHSATPLDKALDQQDFDRLLDHCTQITRTPKDYVSEYLENGVPDAWREMVTANSGQ